MTGSQDGVTVSSLLSHHGDDEVGAGLTDFAVNVAVPRPPGWLRSALTDAGSHRWAVATASTAARGSG